MRLLWLNTDHNLTPASLVFSLVDSIIQLGNSTLAEDAEKAFVYFDTNLVLVLFFVSVTLFDLH